MTASVEADEIDPQADSGLRIEGDDSGGIGDYPLDSLLIRTDTRTVHDVLRREEKGFFILDPDFQRDFVWDQQRQSRLIESILMRIPLPVFYLAENTDGKLVVVDGLQRVTTLKRFLHNDFKLDLSILELNGKAFRDLPAKLQNRLEDAQLTLYIVDAKVPEHVRLDIFERVNSGVVLTRQQMRNALYQGIATKFLKRMSETESFREATGGGLDSKKMRDREVINRFVAFSLIGPDAYQGSMDEFLAEALRLLNGSSESYLVELGAKFEASMRANRNIFGVHAFRKHTTPGEPRKAALNMSLFDVFSVGFAEYDEARLVQKAAQIRAGFFQLMKDNRFIHYVTTGTSHRLQVLGRFHAVEAALRKVMT